MPSPFVPAPHDVTAVRRHNLALVLRLLRQQGRISRTEIAMYTGLAAGAVTSLAAHLIDLGLAREAGTHHTAGSAGRPRRLLEFDGATTGVVAAHIDAHTVTTLAADLAGRPLHRSSVGHGAPPGDPDTVIACLAREITEALTAARVAGARPAAAGIAVAGQIVTGSDTVAFAPNLGWRDVPIVAELRRRLPADVPLLLDNDANLTALAEFRALAANEPAEKATSANGRRAPLGHIVVLSGFVGVGAGVVVDGRLFRGSAGGAGEAGHLVVSPGGRRCWCGQRGCLEAVAAPPELLRQARLTPADPADLPTAFGRLVRRAEADHAPTLRLLGDLADRLADAAGILTTVLGPEAVVLGGYYTRLAPWILPRVENALTELRGFAVYRNIEARAGRFGPDAPIWGAATLAADHIIDNPSRP